MLLFHVRLLMVPRLPHVPLLSGALSPVVEAGYTGVTLFFVLSGFILAHTYLGTGVPTGQYLWARVARVVPVYLLSLAVAFPGFILENLHHRRVLLRGGISVIFMVQSWIPRYAGLVNPPAWSLSNEAFFYLVFPALLALLVRRRAATLGGIAGLAWLAGMIAPFLYIRFAPDGLGARATPFSGTAWLGLVKFWPPIHLPSFVIGVALGVWARRRTLHGAAWGRPVAWLAVAATWALILGRVIPYPVQHDVGLAPLAAVLIAGLATERGGLARLLSWRPIVRLGEASYALYLLHVPLMMYAIAWGKRAGVDTHAPGFALAFIVTVLAASWATLVWIEEPARRRMRAMAMAPRSAGLSSVARATPL